MTRLVFPFSSLHQHLGNSKHEAYFQRYLERMECQQIVVEHEYVDKEYLIDYTSFHARSFPEVARFTTRCHFFKTAFSDDQFKDILVGDADERKTFVKTLQKNYLGFIVVKPVTDHENHQLIGRTLLKPYPPDASNGSRKHITISHKVSLFGLPLEIESLPYQTQDKAVGACASTALWISQFPLREYADLPVMALAEITSAANEFPSPHRRFPSEGLSTEQILSFLGGKQLEVDYIKSPEPEMIPEFVKAYVQCNIPILATLRLTKQKQSDDFHAVIISGYREDSTGRIQELFVHDDQIGPYCTARVVTVNGQKDFSLWENEWRKDYDSVSVDTLIAPVYAKMRLSFLKVYEIIKERREHDALVSQTDLRYEMFLTTVNQYKKTLLDNPQTKDKLLHVTQSMPRFIWIVRTYHRNRLMGDILHDGTLHYARRLKSRVMYQL